MKLFKNIALRIIAPLLALGTAACDSAVYDYEGDCDVNYRLHLTYTRNMKYADAFPAEVTDVGVYVFRTDGTLAWTCTETAERLKADDYTIALPLDPGKYDILVWCGGKSLEQKAHSWTLGGGQPIASKADLHIALDAPAAADGSGKLATSDIHRLYHGTLDAAEMPEDPGTYVYDVDLTKDTNFIRVVLQHADGDPVNPDHFNFRITDTNGHLDHDNLTSRADAVTYNPWAIITAETELPDPDHVAGTPQKTPARATTQISSVVADMTTSRLVKGNKPTIEINCTEPGNEHLVARLDLISYFLMIKGSANRHIEDQEFLDRQDDYTMMLILDDNNRWNLSLGLYINSWRIVRQDTTLQ
ncbi:MAG: FimB/Mfa2 family fimbrial subunit [Muribaculaceae bacterium]|nr:FimB/Mfa2 family fimbrial subunit [Muribaculaceae bacterium]